MSASRFPHPPDGLMLCGGDGWDSMSDAAREEIWLMDAYLRAGGKRVFPEGFKAWAARRAATDSQDSNQVSDG